VQDREVPKNARPGRGCYRYLGAAVLVFLVMTTNVAEAAAHQRTSGPAKSGRHAATTLLGPDGVEAPWVAAENKRPGTTAWQIPPTVDPSGIQGFANLSYGSVGDNVSLYVSTASPTFRVVAYRMGWYQGKGGRQIWASKLVTGQVQPTCPLTPGVNMVSCDNWTASLSMPITRAFVQGDYLLKLVGTGGQESYVPLTVWDPTSTATYLMINRTFTEEGWNAYGGYSYYQGEGACAPGTNSYPVCNRARVVSFDRPYASGNGASDFLSNEYPLLQYSEERGLDTTYVSDVTLDANPQIALRHKAILSLGHDETWSLNERMAVQSAQAQGVNIVFFGAAAVLRHVRLQSSPLGPDREEVNYRDSSEDPLNTPGNQLNVTGNTWASPPTSWSEVPLVGEVYSGYLTGGNVAAFVVSDASAWIYKGTNLANGAPLPGVVQSDIDHVGPGQTGSQQIQVLGHSPVPLASVYTNQGTWGGVTYSDMTYYTDPTSQAGVVDTGTVNWINALAPCAASSPACPATLVQRITGNLLWLFGQGPSGRTTPSVANTQSIQPPGS
jgi:hypothetical protein